MVGISFLSSLAKDQNFYRVRLLSPGNVTECYLIGSFNKFPKRLLVPGSVLDTEMHDKTVLQECTQFGDRDTGNGRQCFDFRSRRHTKCKGT